MITVKVITEHGNNWVTEINATYAEARDYFFTKVKHKITEYEDGHEFIDPIVDVQLIEDKDHE